MTLTIIMTTRRVAVEPSDYERNLRKTLKILSRLPKTLVILLAPIQVSMVIIDQHPLQASKDSCHPIDPKIIPATSFSLKDTFSHHCQVSVALELVNKGKLCEKLTHPYECPCLFGPGSGAAGRSYP